MPRKVIDEDVVCERYALHTRRELGWLERRDPVEQHVAHEDWFLPQVGALRTGLLFGTVPTRLVNPYRVIASERERYGLHDVYPHSSTEGSPPHVPGTRVRELPLVRGAYRRPRRDARRPSLQPAALRSVRPTRATRLARLEPLPRGLPREGSC